MPEQPLGLAHTFVGQPDRLRAADRIVDEPLVVQAIQRRPVEALLGTILLAPIQVEQRQDHFVDGLGVDVHRVSFLRGPPSRSGRPLPGRRIKEHLVVQIDREAQRPAEIHMREMRRPHTA